ncbi:MAG TPA: M24 family metallopeptidase [Aliidongia sp.]|nr:M24 family metallopeptidase [Aliidongia sp.]
MTDQILSGPERRAALLAAEGRANELLDTIERMRLIAPGRTERMVEADIYALAEQRFGVEKHWHKRIVRAGSNTLAIASDNPPERTIEPEDIVYVDLGPVFEEWEADVGRSYALGDDPEKRALVADLPVIFERVRDNFRANPDITGAQLYAFAQIEAADAGWMFGGQIAGHLVAEFAHAHIPGNKDLNKIWPRNPSRMRDPDALGREKHWILEIHLVDRARRFGGFYERLL